MRRILIIWLISLVCSATALSQLPQPKQTGSTAVPQPARRSENSDHRFDEVRAHIQKRIVEWRIPSVAVAVAQDGRIIWEEAFGWADRENRIPATAHTMYSLASISKPITATGLMVLKERGQIDLNRPINDYLGDAKVKVRVGNPADATVARVLNHTAGLPLHYQFFYQDEPYRRPAMDESIRRYGNAVTAPGERYNYSNFGYGIIDYVISRASKKSYTDFMREEVFIPLGLTRMSVNVGPGLEKYQAVRYGPDGLPIPFYDFDHPGASAVYASAHDLVRFGMFHLSANLSDQKPIISEANIQEMQKPTARINANQGYGIGWLSETRGGHRSVQHTGGMPGVSTLLALYPEEKIAIAVLINSSSLLTMEAYEKILSVVLPAAAPRPSFNNPANTEPFPPSDLVGTWTGKVFTYNEEIPLTLGFKPSGDVHVKLGSQLNTLLNNISLRDGNLSGRMMGDLGIEDASRQPSQISLSLKLRGNVLNGAATAISVPGKRVAGAVSQWVELVKEK
jgi:CubicO group peptidase (beta-lactamase class C family)